MCPVWERAPTTRIHGTLAHVNTGDVPAPDGGTFVDIVGCDFDVDIAEGGFHTAGSGDRGLLDPDSAAGRAYGSVFKTKAEAEFDTSRDGRYSARRTMSVSGSVLSIRAHCDSGQPYGGGIKPLFPAETGDRNQRTFGASEVRFRVREVTSQRWGAAFLWISTTPGRWPVDGELDWPEKLGSDLLGGFHHHARAQGGQDRFSADSATWADWHTARTEWMPGRVRYLLDGETVLDTDRFVGAEPMGFQLQVGTTGGIPEPGSQAIFDLDWFRVQRFVPM